MDAERKMKTRKGKMSFLRDSLVLGAVFPEANCGRQTEKWRYTLAGCHILRAQNKQNN